MYETRKKKFTDVSYVKQSIIEPYRKSYKIDHSTKLIDRVSIKTRVGNRIVTVVMAVTSVWPDLAVSEHRTAPKHSV